MRIPRLPTRPWVTIAAVVATAAILLTVFHQSNATANTGPPGTPANTLAHLIVPDGEEPRIRVSWDGSESGATGYTISRGDGQTFAANGAATTFSDHSVEPGTAYSYTVIASNGQGDSPVSMAASASVADAPSAPGNLSAAVAESTAADETASVTLKWTASSVPPVEQCDIWYPLDGYTISRSDGTDEVEIGTAAAGVTSFTDPNARFSSSYTYRVAARNAIGASPATETATTIPSRLILPPTGLSATITDPFNGNISLSWTAPAAGPEITGYLVLRYDGADPLAGDAIPTTLAESATETTLVDSSANAGSAYSYVVIALSADNVSEPAHSAAIEPPAPPTGLMAVAANGTIGLSWTEPDAGTIGTYQLERQPQSGEWAHLADITETDHNDDTAQDNATYAYRVQHRNNHGGSTWSQSEPVTLVVVPGAPTGVSATASGNDNVLAWTAPDSPFIDGYRVRHQTDGDWATLANDVASDSVTYTHQNAAADVTHHYAVQAHNSAGDGPWSDTASTGRITPPLAPSSVTTTLEDDDISLTWTRPNSVHVDGYTVRHRAGTEQPFVESEQLDATATSYTIEDIAGDTVYRLMVRAHNNGGDGPWSEPVEIERVLFPTAPTSVSVATDDQNITVSWSAPDTGRVAGYHVSYGTAESEERHTVSRTADETSFVHTDSTEGVAYAYQVRAHNPAGNGPWSETIQATRLLVPAAPSNLSATPSGGSIDVSWQAPQSSIVASYEIEYGLSSETERATASVSGEHDYFTHTGSQGDVQYQYRVRSVNVAGQSSWTDAVTATRVLSPGKPTNVATAISGNNIKVTWSAPESVFIDGYHVELRQQEIQDWTRHTVSGTTASFTHVSPDAGTTYEYRVRTYNTGGVSNWSSKATAIWYQGAAPPAQIITQTWNNNTQLLVRWSPSTTSRVTGYEVRHRIDGGDWSSETTTSTLVFHDWDPDGENLREYSVRSEKNDAYGDWSAIRKFTIAQPSAVTGVVTNREGTNGVRLHWDEPDSGQPVQYFIEYSTGDGNWTRSGISAGYKRTHRFASQPYDSTYSFRVMAVNDVYMTGTAGETTVTMAAEPRHHTNMPDNLKIKMLDRDRVRLKWDAPEDYPTGVSAYRIYRKDVTDPSTLMRFGWEETLVRHTGGTERTYVDLTAQPGRLYAYAVAAYRVDDDNRLSPASNPAYAQPW